MTLGSKLTIAALALALSACGSGESSADQPASGADAAQTASGAMASTTETVVSETDAGMDGMNMSPEEMAAMNEGGSAPGTNSHTASGTIQSISGNVVTIAHGPVESLGWPAMTMSFTGAADQLVGLQPGAKVRFGFVQEGGAQKLTFIRRGQ